LVKFEMVEILLTAAGGEGASIIFLSTEEERL